MSLSLIIIKNCFKSYCGFGNLHKRLAARMQSKVPMSSRIEHASPFQQFKRNFFFSKKKTKGRKKEKRVCEMLIELNNHFKKRNAPFFNKNDKLAQSEPFPVDNLWVSVLHNYHIYLLQSTHYMKYYFSIMKKKKKKYYC